jgi:hypothetical protein
MEMHDRLSSLYADLSNIEAKSRLDWSVGLVFNALLAQAKEDHPDDPVVQAIEPVRQSSSGRLVAGPDAGALRTLVGQLLTVYPPRGPAVA